MSESLSHVDLLDNKNSPWRAAAGPVQSQSEEQTGTVITADIKTHPLPYMKTGSILTFIFRRNNMNASLC